MENFIFCAMNVQDVLYPYFYGTTMKVIAFKLFYMLPCHHDVNVTKSSADLVTFAEEILNEKLHFLCSEIICNTAKAYSGPCQTSMTNFSARIKEKIPTPFNKNSCRGS